MGILDFFAGVFGPPHPDEPIDPSLGSHREDPSIRRRRGQGHEHEGESIFTRIKEALKYDDEIDESLLQPAEYRLFDPPIRSTATSRAPSPGRAVAPPAEEEAAEDEAEAEPASQLSDDEPPPPKRRISRVPSRAPTAPGSRAASPARNGSKRSRQPTEESAVDASPQKVTRMESEGSSTVLTPDASWTVAQLSDYVKARGGEAKGLKKAELLRVASEL